MYSQGILLEYEKEPEVYIGRDVHGGYRDIERKRDIAEKLCNQNNPSLNTFKY